MAFVPIATGRRLPEPLWRFVIFWALMILLAIVLWQMSSRGTASVAPWRLTYSDFMEQVKSNNVGTADVSIAQNTADISGDLKSPGAPYRTTVPRDTLTGLLDTLRSEGVNVKVAERTSAMRVVVAVLPIVTLIAFWLFMMRVRMQKQGNSSSGKNMPPGALG